MKKVFLIVSVLSVLFFLNSCSSEVCIKCVKYDYSDSLNFCSSEKSERNNFMVEWIRQNYNCREAISE